MTRRQRYTARALSYLVCVGPLLGLAWRVVESGDRWLLSSASIMTPVQLCIRLASGLPGGILALAAGGAIVLRRHAVRARWRRRATAAVVLLLATLTAWYGAGIPKIETWNAVPRHAISLRLLLAIRPGNLTARDGLGNSPLHYAAAGVLKETAFSRDYRILGGLSPPVGYDGQRTIIHEPVEPRSIGEKLQGRARFVTEQDGWSWTPWRRPASGTRTTDPVRLLLRRGADVNAHNRSGLTPLHLVAAAGARDLMRTLIDHGADVNAADTHGQTPLHMARDAAALEVLLDAGADVTVTYGVAKWTRLHEVGRVQEVEVLLAAGADIGARTRGRQTPLHTAVRYRRALPVIQALLAAGADVNARDQTGYTALHHAVYHGNLALVNALLQAGADAQAQNQDGETPLDALNWPNREEHAHTARIAALLRQAASDRAQPPSSP